MSRVPRSARPPLSREGILRSALKLIDRDGLDAFSVRRLAAARRPGCLEIPKGRRGRGCPVARDQVVEELDPQEPEY